MWKECDKILALYINFCDPVFYGQPQMGLVIVNLNAAQLFHLHSNSIKFGTAWDAVAMVELFELLLNVETEL